MLNPNNMNLVHTLGAAFCIRSLLYAAPDVMRSDPAVEPLPYVALAVSISSIYLQMTTDGPWNKERLLASALNLGVAGAAVAMIFLREHTPQSSQGASPR